jgi:hypothetical protein
VRPLPESRTEPNELGGRCQRVRIYPGEHSVEDRVLGLLDRSGGEVDRVDCVGLRPCGVGVGDIGVDLRLSGIDMLANALDVLVPIALELMPAIIGVAGGAVRLGAHLAGVFVGTLTRGIHIALEFHLVLCGCRLDPLIGPFDLLGELCEAVRRGRVRSPLGLVA